MKVVKTRFYVFVLIFMSIFTLIFISKVKYENKKLEQITEVIKYKIFNSRRLYLNSMKKILYSELSGNVISRTEKLEMMTKTLNELNHKSDIYVENIFGVESDSLDVPIKINDIPSSQFYTARDLDLKILELDKISLNDDYLARHFEIKKYDNKVFIHVLFPFYYQHKLVKIHGIILDLTKNLESFYEKRESFFGEAYYTEKDGFIIGDIYKPIYSKNNDLKKIELDNGYKIVPIYDDYLMAYKLNMFSVAFYSAVISSIIMIIIRWLFAYKMRYDVAHQNSALDSLTHIYNRRGFLNFYEKNMQLSAIAILDIDDFKKINDTYGHAAGDIVLVKTSNLLQKIFLQCESFCERNEIFLSKNCCVRWGGEEFLIGMQLTDEDEFLNLLEMVRVEVKKLTFKDYPNMKVTVSIGASIRKIDSMDLFYDTFKITDSNLYKAKKTGKNKIIFSNEEEGIPIID